jgi:hypothetical protein
MHNLDYHQLSLRDDDIPPILHFSMGLRPIYTYTFASFISVLFFLGLFVGHIPSLSLDALTPSSPFLPWIPAAALVAAKQCPLVLRRSWSLGTNSLSLQLKGICLVACLNNNNKYKHGFGLVHYHS